MLLPLQKFVPVLLLLAQTTDNNPRVQKWPSLKIPVCWEKSAAAYTTEKAWVQQAITNTWQKESRIEFTAWCPCTSKMPGIHIAVEDAASGPRVQALGAKLDRVDNGMYLNFTLQKWGSGLVVALKTRKTAIEAVAVHEFGHALGFTHQQSRQGCTLCNAKPEDLKGFEKEVQNGSDKEGLWTTPCDAYSVMNYCSEEYANGGRLSRNDVDAVQFIYGKPERLTDNKPVMLQYTATPISKAEKQKRDLQSQPQAQQLRMEYEVVDFRWYDIQMNIVASESLLKTIEKVEYYIDPSFPLNKRIIKDPGNRFKLSFLAWGNFDVKAKVFFKNNSPMVELQESLYKIPPFKVKVKKIRDAGQPTIRTQGSKGGSPDQPQ